LIVRLLYLWVALVATVNAAQWEPSLASIASLRTGGAELVSSDAVTLDSGDLALVTYWEVRTKDDLDVYRCIDVVDSRLSNISQQCWSALRPTGRGPVVLEQVRSSADICGRPDDLGGISTAAYCSFSQPTTIRTSYFSLMVMPLDGESLVSVGDEGGSLVVTSQPWPGSTFFEVRATDRRSRAFFAGVSSTSEIPQLQDGNTVCEATRVAGRDWMNCQSNGAETVTNYLIEGNMLYEVSYSANVSATVRQAMESIFNSLDVGEIGQP
jgi:hypothetical protein